ncbi:MAG: SDR family NAD(P)-dependent oxidoreductase [Saprospiraceae bacterium]
MKEILKKIVFITGGGSGIGAATAKTFAKNGYSVIITGRRTNKLKEVQQNLEEKYAIDVRTLAFDIRKYSDVEKALKSLNPPWNKIDVLVNNAGLAVGLDSIENGDLQDWESMIDTNIKGLLYITRFISPLMVKQGHGDIINVGSTSGDQIYPNGNVYCATKAAVNMLTQGMRLDLYKKGIRVSEVNPAHVETGFASVRFKGNAKKAAIYDDFTPLKAKDVAKTIYFIASAPRHVTIQNIVLAGTQQAGANFIDRSGKKYVNSDNNS